MDSIFTLFFIVYGLFFLGVPILMFLLIRYMIRKRKKMTPEKVRAVLEEAVEKRRPNLVPHKDYDALFLSQRTLKNFYAKGISLEKERGILADTNGEPMLFYIWADPAIIQSKMQLIAVTSRKTYFLRLHKGFMILKVNDQIVGFHNYRSGAILDKDRKVIGVINRYLGDKTAKISEFQGFNFDVYRQLDNSSFPVQFTSGTKAYITNKYSSSNRKAINIDSQHLYEHEQDWLVALTVNYLSGALWE
ncbi:MAG: hypothetical protein ACPG19_12845 [Saprospiraceae bacterium]